MKRLIVAILVLVIAGFVTAVPADAGRDLMDFYQQESWLAYAVFSPSVPIPAALKLIDVRDDNYLFGSIDSSFAMRNAVAVWRLSALVAGEALPLDGDVRELRERAAVLSPIKQRVLELLADEAAELYRHIPKGVQYRLTILALGDYPDMELVEPLAELPGEHLVSKQSMTRWNKRLPLSAADVRENAVAPYVVVTGEGIGIRGLQIVVNRSLSEKIVHVLGAYRGLTERLSGDQRKALLEITSKNLTGTLKGLFSSTK